MKSKHKITCRNDRIKEPFKPSYTAEEIITKGYRLGGHKNFLTLHNCNWAFIIEIIYKAAAYS